MKTKINPTAALTIALDILRAAAVRGARKLPESVEEYIDSLSLKVERGWACDVDLYVSVRCADYTPRKLDQHDETLYLSWEAKVEVSTSGTIRSAAGSVAYAALLAEVSALAAEIETRLGEVTIATPERKKVTK